MGVFAFCLCAKAQSIRVVEDESRTQTVSLNGKAEAVFIANSDKMFIETSRPSLDVKKSVKKGSSGQWEYVFELQLQTQEGSASARTFTITQKGSASKNTFKKGKWGNSGVVEVDAPNGSGKIKMPGRIEVDTLPAGTGFWYFNDSQQPQQVEW